MHDPRIRYPICLPLPSRSGYAPQLPHDACGVGMICDIKGRASNALVRQALAILINLTHRGACGCDATTGDGAGILLQMPDLFLRRECRAQGMTLPDPGGYGAGLVFLPPDRAQRRRCRQTIEDIVQAEGQSVLGWRDVPVNHDALGDLARSAEPAVRQLFVGRSAAVSQPEDFERKLYVIRKVIETRLRTSVLPQRSYFHIPSLSSRTLIYKGLFVAQQLAAYYRDLTDPDLASALAIVHQRYSTNTLPAWDLAHPFRFLCHNGEINTLRGNINWMNARQALLRSPLFGADLAKLMPIATPGASDSAILDNAVELLYHAGRSLPHCIMMLIPEPWQANEAMDPVRRDFYAYHAGLMEPWDGPAAICFTDGIQIGAVLDRNGLRPARFTVTRQGQVVLASETGVLDIAPEDVLQRGRIAPGRMLLVDTAQGRIIEDEEIKDTISRRRPYGVWLRQQQVALPLGPAAAADDEFGEMLPQRQKLFGYSTEDLKLLLAPMAQTGKEPVGSMGDDIPPAILSRRPRLLYDYFRQLFAQVTNPPLDAIREALVTSLETTIGAERNLLDETPDHARQLRLPHPLLSGPQLAAIRAMRAADFRTTVLDMTYPVDQAGAGMAQRLEQLCRQAADAVEGGVSLLILSDRGADDAQAPLPALLATSAVHHHLIREGQRPRCALIVDTGEAREIHHFCCLLGYGAGAVHPYLAYATVGAMARDGRLGEIAPGVAEERYRQAVGKGILKVMSKMGISTLQSYRGAQIFECVGLAPELVETHFTWTSSRIKGADLNILAEETRQRHAAAFPGGASTLPHTLDPGGKYRWRRGGEVHQYNPMTIARLQQAVRQEDADAWRDFSERVNRQNREEGLIRGLIDLRAGREAVPLAEVEPWTAIVRRFKTGAMSYGSISQEAHETQAIAMNRIGGRSNSGEGGEDPERYLPDADGTWRNSAIKQVASGRFGVTIQYLASARELQIKMAQGAKPGEGGQLPGSKVYPWIAKTRHATPWVGLISPPPHHDIYSIEDLAQLIYDLKMANPSARVSVKLVSEVGVGTVAAGVAKAGADSVLISGEAGGTGASPQTSIRHGGLPWELGLAETQQVLQANGLRDRIVVETDGQLKTARDVAIACLLGAEEFGFGTVSLVTLGCIMMRVCHLNTCPVGIATQDPELRRKFAGRPEHLIAFMRFVAEDLRAIMASLGFRRVAEMVGQVSCLETAPALDHWKARGLDLSAILAAPQVPRAVAEYCTAREIQPAPIPADQDLTETLAEALIEGRPAELDIKVRNRDRTFGTRLSHAIARRHGAQGLPEDTIVINARGTGGQSFGAFGARGLTIHLRGEANDYFGKGLSGARLTLRPLEGEATRAEDNIIVGNVALYGATSGEVFIRGQAGERFCVRNSGAWAVVEGVGDHGCEYMTGGRAVILGPTGRNFAAGMSGGVAYVWDPAGDFARQRCNREMVVLEPVSDASDQAELQILVEKHARYTQSARARLLLDDWASRRAEFVKVIPVEYKRAMERLGGEESPAD